MKKVVKTLKQSLSILLAVAMVITCVPQTTIMSYAASDTDFIATDADAAADENAAGVEVSTDDSDLVLDEGAVVPADTAGDEVETDLTEGGSAVNPDTDNSGISPQAGDISVTLAETDKSIAYDGAPHQPAPVIKDGEDTIVEADVNTNFEITYARKEATTENGNDFTNVGEFTITVTGKTGTDYAGKTATVDYKIVAADISADYEISGVEAEYETSDALTAPEVEVVKKGATDTKLTKDTDYTVAFTRDGEPATDFKAVGTVTVTVTGKGNYTGTLTTTYEITAAKTALTDAMVKLSYEGYTLVDGKTDVVEYTGEAITPAVTVKVTEGADPLVEDTDYTVAYTNNTEAGTATVTVTGKGDYTGTVTKTFTIEDTRLDISDSKFTVTVDPAANLKYTGAEITPDVTVTYQKDSSTDSVTLTKDTDYTVSYTGNVEVGTATVSLEGKGRYKGTKTATFTIAKADALTAITGTIYADTTITESSRTQDLTEFAFTTGDGKVVAGESYTVGNETGDVVSGDVLDESSAPAITDTTLTYTLKASLNPAGVTTNGTIVVNVSFKNYEDSKLTLTVEPVAKTEIYLKGAADEEEKEYDGQPFTYNTAKITQHVSNAEDAAEVEADANKVEAIKDYLTYSYAGKGDTTYVASATAPVNAGTYQVTVSLSSQCKGYKAAPFTTNLTITKKGITITPNNRNWTLGTTIPATQAEAGDYTVTPALVGDDTIQTQPTFTYKKADGTTLVDANWATLEAGEELTIEASGASAGDNYNITYATGTLTVKPAKGTPVTTYAVTLHYNQKTVPDTTIDVEVGSTIDIAKNAATLYPTVSGYQLQAWYQDAAYKKVWNFDTDTVQGNIDLYALWTAGVGQTGPALVLQDIPDQVYTGSKLQPSVLVYDAEGTLLKKGKDYSITYANNTNADVALADGAPAGGYGASLEDTEYGFNKNLPYITITGKGNYAGTKQEPNVIYKNFHINKASIGSGDTLASGFTMKYTNQFVAGTKDLKPFTSLKYKKAMTLGTDYDVTIIGKVGEAFSGKNEDGAGIALTEDYSANNTGKTAPVITKGYYGDFTITVTAKGNYEGTVAVPVVVAADADKLLKNAKINLGSKIKTVKFADYINDETGAESVELPVANVRDGKYYQVVDGVEKVYGEDEATLDSKFCFTVSMGKGKNIKYLNAGKATVEGQTQNADFTISYANNDAVGKATLTIEAAEGSGYVGSLSTTFTIKGDPFTSKTNKNNPNGTPIKVTGINASYPYTGSYITMNNAITVETADGTRTGEGDDAVFTPKKAFVFGEDYTVKYANNLKKGTATVTFTANPKSGYTGSFKKTFKIGQVSLYDEGMKLYDRSKTSGGLTDDAKVTVTPPTEKNKPATATWSTQIPYAAAGSQIDYMLVDGEGNVLKSGTDFTAKYTNNKKVGDDKKLPTLTITGKGNYTGKIVITFTIVNTNKDALTISAAATQLKAAWKNKPDSQYKPAVTVKEGTKKISAKGNYEVTYARNTEAEVEAYLAALDEGKSVEDLQPIATVKISESSAYYTAPGADVTTDEAKEAWNKEHNTVVIPLEIYQTKLTSGNCDIVLTGNNSQYRYTGKQVTPTVVSVNYVVKQGKTVVSSIPLKYGTDYGMSYGANVAAGKNKGSVTITGKGIYGGSVTKKFNINTSYIYQPAPTQKTALTTDNCTVVLSLGGEPLEKDQNGKPYTEATGKQICPVVEVTYKETAAATGKAADTNAEGKVLTQGDDYTVSYGNNTEVGEGTVTITAKDNSDYYTGSFDVKFDIKPATVQPVDKTELTADSCEVKLNYGGQEVTKDGEGKYTIKVATIPEAGIEPEVAVTLKGEDGSDTSLVKGTDYTVTYSNNKAAGEATATIAAVEDSKYTGSFGVNFTIEVSSTNPPTTKTTLSAETCTVELSLNETTLTVGADGKYSAEVTEIPSGGVKPSVKVTLKGENGANGTVLAETTDYTVTYSSNEAAGDATVTITGTGNYEGTIELTFTITVNGTTPPAEG
ncbi:MAG: InlB B-repeat-containing protein [Blautia sp.]|nr:InlB B-repeat-containing protein [Blautia sp.]MCM1218356.1 InlB B-repeat-containing protein [Lachnospiraceae bacterium]